MKPSNIEPRIIPPVKLQPYERYLPTAFDNSLSILEKINKVIHYLYEYSKITDEMLKKWNEVYDWVMNEGLEIEVSKKLDGWLEDGTIDEIINEKLFNKKLDKDEFYTFVNELMNDINKNINNLYINAVEPPIPLIGIKMDGSDETNTLNSLLNFIQLNNETPQYPEKRIGGKIFLPPGEIIVKDKINIYGGVTLSGAGMYSTIIKYKGNELTENEFIFNVGGVTTRGVTIEGFTICGDSKDNTPGFIKLENTHEWKLADLNIYNLNQGFTTQNAWVGKIDNVTIKHVKKSSYLNNGSHNVELKNVVFGRTEMGYSNNAVKSHLAIRNSWGVNVVNCDFEFGDHYNLDCSIYVFHAVRGLNVENCYFESNTGYAIYFRDSVDGDNHSCGGVTISSNFINQKNGKGFYFRKQNPNGLPHKGVVIQGNFVNISSDEYMIVDSPNNEYVVNDSNYSGNMIFSGKGERVNSQYSGWNEYKNIKSIETYRKSFSVNSAPRGRNENISLWDYMQTPYTDTPINMTSDRYIISGVSYLVTVQLTESNNKMHSGLYMVSVKGNGKTITPIIPVNGDIDVVDNKLLYVKASGFSCAVSISLLPLTGDTGATEVYDE